MLSPDTFDATQDTLSDTLNLDDSETAVAPSFSFLLGHLPRGLSDQAWSPLKVTGVPIDTSLSALPLSLSLPQDVATAAAAAAAAATATEGSAVLENPAGSFQSYHHSVSDRGSQFGLPLLSDSGHRTWDTRSHGFENLSSHGGFDAISSPTFSNTDHSFDQFGVVQNISTECPSSLAGLSMPQTTAVASFTCSWENCLWQGKCLSEKKWVIFFSCQNFCQKFTHD